MSGMYDSTPSIRPRNLSRSLWCDNIWPTHTERSPAFPDTSPMLYHPTRKNIIRRFASQPLAGLDHLPPVLQRIYAVRQLNGAPELDRSLSRLPSPFLLSGMHDMTERLEAVIREQKKLLIIADYDADGATACCVAMLGLALLGAERVEYLVPSRFGFGYGLTPELARVAAGFQPDVLLTVDNGIASLEGVRVARELGMDVLITDHHLPGSALPEAHAIVNPGLPGETFPGRHLAGVGVMFYVLLALRQTLRESGWFIETGREEPNLGQLLDLVALGTVADVVPLDHVNRILVHQGVLRIRKGLTRPGLQALMAVAGKTHTRLNATDLGFAIAPRLNAAGRMEDMSTGIECLLTSSPDRAQQLAESLNTLNGKRKTVEADMKRDAEKHLAALVCDSRMDYGICLYDANWHQGVIGILASRIKERLHRPVIVFAPGQEGEIKGSARSIEGIHIRDALSDIATAHPGILSKFGGHAMAAGLSLKTERYEEFARLFAADMAERLAGRDLEQAVLSDGSLAAEEMALELAEVLETSGPWGQGFPEPLFDGEFEVLKSWVLKERHIKFMLKSPDKDTPVAGIAFSVEHPEAWLNCQRIRLAYRLDINEYRDERSVQIRVEYMEAAPP